VSGDDWRIKVEPLRDKPRPMDMIDMILQGCTEYACLVCNQDRGEDRIGGNRLLNGRGSGFDILIRTRRGRLALIGESHDCYRISQSTYQNSVKMVIVNFNI